MEPLNIIILTIVTVLFGVSIYFNVTCGMEYWNTPYFEVPYKCRMFMN